jgi:hypothetical protein
VTGSKAPPASGQSAAEKLASLARYPSRTACGVYLVISILFFGLRVVGSPSTAHVGFTSDAAMMMWYLVWWPCAIWHRINPFITHAVWPISGYNLTWATSIPGVALAVAPITAAFGPVVAYNVAALLAPAMSGWAAFELCRRVTRSFGASLAGGFVYGYSPYQLAHAYAGHLPFTLSFVPPCCVLLVLKLLEQQRQQGAKPAVVNRSCTIALALLLVLQFLISTEALATMTVFGGAAIMCGYLLLPGERLALQRAVPPIVLAYGAAAVMLAPFLYGAFVAGAPPREVIFPSAFYSADLMSFIRPGPLMLIPPGNGAVLIAHSAKVWEEGCYLSLPLLAIAVAYFWSHRREPAARLLAAVAIMSAVAALGPVLHVNRHAIIGLPWRMVDALPLIRQALPIRCANYLFLALAIVVSLWINDENARFKKLAMVGLVLTFLPNPVLAVQKSTFDTPAFFGQGLYRRYIRPNETVLIIPYGRNGDSMAWQAESWMYFRMPGGHLSTTPEDFRRWPVVNTLETAIPLPDAAEQFKAFAVANRIDAVVVTDRANGAERELPGLLGIRPLHIDGVSLYQLQTNSLRDPQSLPFLQKSASEGWVSMLLCAAQRYSAAGGNLGDLDPAKAHDMALLPNSKWSATLDLLLAASAHGASNGLWLGPARNNGIAVGLFTSPSAAAELLSRYRPYLVRALYPYPRVYSTMDGSSLHFMLLDLESAAATRACN